MTVRIVGVNAIALIILVFGIFYLGQYRSDLIETRLKTFKSEMDLVAASLTESSIENQILLPAKIQRMTERLGGTLHKHIRVFDINGSLIANSHPDGIIDYNETNDDTLQSLKVLRDMVGFVLSLVPQENPLPQYPNAEHIERHNYPDIDIALSGQLSLSAWTIDSALDDSQDILLSGAIPLWTRASENSETGLIHGAVLITHNGRDIERDLITVWGDLLKIFAGTLVLTVILSIYLSGTIAQPLRRLAKAAETVRVGKNRETIIPDLSERHDEIGELSIVLRDMTEALWERMDSLEAFAADVSHELKNPLTSLKSAVETAEIVKKPEDQKKLLSVIKHDIERLDRLITDISSASRLDAELSRESFKRLDITSVLYDLIDMYKDPLERKIDQHITDKIEATHNGVTISLNLTEHSDLKTFGIEGRLVQVFHNLISNALSFSPKDSQITLSLKNDTKTVIITVEDEGSGIPEGKLENIFERFYSERPGHEDYGNHSGLGLSICRQIIEAHGGKIFAENRVEQDKILGAKFTVLLPFLQENRKKDT